MHPFLLCIVLAFDFVGSTWSFVILSPPQRSMTPDFEIFLFQILSITCLSYLKSSERASISLCNVERLTRELLVPLYNVFGMTLSLTGDWTRNLAHWMPALYQWKCLWTHKCVWDKSDNQFSLYTRTYVYCMSC